MKKAKINKSEPHSKRVASLKKAVKQERKQKEERALINKDRTTRHKREGELRMICFSLRKLLDILKVLPYSETSSLNIGLFVRNNLGPYWTR